MEAMFSVCKSTLVIDVTNFDTTLVAIMTLMFDGCWVVTTLDVTGFVTTACTDMWGMFNACEDLTALDVSGFDTSLVVDMDSMFRLTLTLTDITGVDDFDIEGLGFTYSLDNFALSGKIGTTTYTSLLTLWAAQNPFDSMDPHFGTGSTYTLADTPAVDGRAKLIATDLWSITDGGGI